MVEPVEVVISSDTSGQLWSSSVWDIHSGTLITSYRGGGVAAPGTLCILGQDYIASVERTKPILHIWPLNSQERVQGLRLVTPGRATALAFSPDGCYCVAGISDKICIWQISSGALLVTISRHFQTINIIKFCDDGSHFVSAGDDGIVLVWNLMHLITHSGIDITTRTHLDPLYIFSDHSLPVKDIYIGKGGIRSRLVTVSLDRTCKIYDLSCGELLLNIVFDKSLSAVTMDLIEMNVYVGTVEGDIHQFSITNPPRTREYHINDKDKAISFIGHTKAITCLSCSVDGETLVSGSIDENLNVWHIPSRQKTNSISHKGAITNAFFTIVPKNMFTTSFSPSIVLHSFQRNNEDIDSIEILSHETHDFWEPLENNGVGLLNFVSSSVAPDPQTDNKVVDEVKKLKQANQSLYSFAVENIFKEIKSKEK